jgi:hypothetical protein
VKRLLVVFEGRRGGGGGGGAWPCSRARASFCSARCFPTYNGRLVRFAVGFGARAAPCPCRRFCATVSPSRPLRHGLTSPTDLKPLFCNVKRCQRPAAARLHTCSFRRRSRCSSSAFSLRKPHVTQCWTRNNRTKRAAAAHHLSSSFASNECTDCASERLFWSIDSSAARA